MKSPSSEYELLADLQTILTEHSDIYEIEIGDDAAVRKSTDADKLIFTTDLSVENVHFRLDWMSFYEIGYKSMVSNVSDCASMGAVPESALIQLTFPKNTEHLRDCIKDIYRGFNEACTRWHFPVIGGDLSGGAQWSIGITLIGKIPINSRCLKRKGAQSGDKLWVSGLPGKSAAGLDVLRKWGRKEAPREYKDFLDAHIRPEPRIELGLILREIPHIHAMMDLSDGLSKDCRTLAFENNLGIILDIDSSLIPNSMIELGDNIQKEPLDWLLDGGEEYELLFAASPSFRPSVLPSEYDRKCICIGEFSNNYHGLGIKNKDGIREILKGGWDHV
jgi:thiamine-monophosphate kinase